MSARSIAPMACALFVALLVSSAHGKDDYYVDAARGDDTSGDGSAGSPWRTITHSARSLPIGPHRLLIHPGTYDSGLGETFPIEPPLGMTLEAMAGQDVTRIVGVPDQPVIRLVGGGGPFSVLLGLTIEGGSEGVRLEGSAQQELRVRLVLCRVTGNINAGVRSIESINLVVQRSTVSSNGQGLHHSSLHRARCWIEECSITENLGDGILVEHTRSDNVSVELFQTKVAKNLGFGFLQYALSGSTYCSINNSVIDSNQAGGVRSVSYSCDGCFLWPTVGISDSTVYGNGAATGNGGLEFVGDGGCFCQILNSIAWGNVGLDNANFTPSYSNVGTGQKSGWGMISGDPRFVDGPGGDLRLQPTSPCLDRISPGTASGYDHEGEPRPTDGNGDGDFKADMGADELHPFVAPGVPPVTGAPFYFITGGPVTERGQLVTVLLSHDDGADTGGIRLPGSGGLTVDLAPGLLFQTGLMLLPSLQTILRAGRTTETPTVTLPPNPFGPEIYYAAVAFDIALGRYGHVTPTRLLIQQ